MGLVVRNMGYPPAILLCREEEDAFLSEEREKSFESFNPHFEINWINAIFAIQHCSFTRLVLV